MKKYLNLFPFIALVIFSVLLFVYVTPDEIISIIGLQNAFILMFVFSFLAGISSTNAAPYYYLLFLLGNAGLNPLVLGIIAGAGIICGDTFTYYMGKETKNVLPHWLEVVIEKIKKIALERPKVFPIFCFLYGCISPVSNTFITMAAGIAEIPFYKIMIPLGLGNIVFNVGLAYMIVYANSFVTKLIG